MKITEVPEEYKVYTLRMSNKDEFEITGTQKVALMRSKDQFVELANGNIINKSFILDVVLNNEATRNNVQKNKPKLLT